MTVLLQFIVPTTAYAAQYVARQTPEIASQFLATKENSSVPTVDSRLFLVLDRSGSLLTTDSQGYSVSLARAIAHLWPGVITFLLMSGDGSLISVIGSYHLSNPKQRTKIEAQLENLPPVSGDTPIAPTLQKVLALLQKQGIPPGSRGILITDGGATGLGNNDTSHQEQEIREQLIPEFSKLSFPVSVYGLNIPNTLEGQDANQLLSDIANGTHGDFDHVTNVSSLARVVVRMFAEWSGLLIERVPPTPAPAAPGQFAFSLNSFTQNVFVAIFRTNSEKGITFADPLRYSISALELGDRHFAFEHLVAQNPIRAGVYDVQVSRDSAAQVFVFIASPLSLRVQLKGKLNHSVSITVEIVDGNTNITPSVGEAQAKALVSCASKNHIVGKANWIDLSQQSLNGQPGSLFTGTTIAYTQPCTLIAKVELIYQNTTIEGNGVLNLVQTKVFPSKKDPTNPVIPITITVLGPIIVCMIFRNGWISILFRRRKFELARNETPGSVV